MFENVSLCATLPNPTGLSQVQKVLKHAYKLLYSHKENAKQLKCIKCLQGRYVTVQFVMIVHAH